MLYYNFILDDISFWTTIIPITILVFISILLERNKELFIIIFQIALVIIGFATGMFWVGMMSLLGILAVLLFHKFSIDRW